MDGTDHYLKTTLMSATQPPTNSFFYARPAPNPTHPFLCSNSCSAPRAGSIFVGIAPCSNNVRFTAGAGIYTLSWAQLISGDPITNPETDNINMRGAPPHPTPPHQPCFIAPRPCLISASSGTATITDTTLKMCSQE